MCEADDFFGGGGVGEEPALRVFSAEVFAAAFAEGLFAEGGVEHEAAAGEAEDLGGCGEVGQEAHGIGADAVAGKGAGHLGMGEGVGEVGRERGEGVVFGVLQEVDEEECGRRDAEDARECEAAGPALRCVTCQVVTAAREDAADERTDGKDDEPAIAEEDAAGGGLERGQGYGYQATGDCTTRKHEQCLHRADLSYLRARVVLVRDGWQLIFLWGVAGGM